MEKSMSKRLALTWANHIETIANKISKNVGIIRKIAHLFSTKTPTSLNYTIINSYLIMVGPNIGLVWASNYDSRIHCLI